MKHNFHTSDDTTHLYIAEIRYPCGFYTEKDGVFKCQSYMFRDGYGTSDPGTNFTFDTLSKEAAEKILLALAEKNARAFYPHIFGGENMKQKLQKLKEIILNETNEILNILTNMK